MMMIMKFLNFVNSKKAAMITELDRFTNEAK